VNHPFSDFEKELEGMPAKTILDDVLNSPSHRLHLGMLTDEILQREFPELGERTYLNTAAEGIPPRSFRDALLRYADDKTNGMEGREALFAEFAACQESAGSLFGMSANEISFCSSTSEAYNLLSTAIDFGNDGEAVISNLDFPSGATPWLISPGKPRVRLWKHNRGVLELEDLASLLNEKTRLVQLSLVSFLTGYRLPWAEVQSLVRERAPQAVLAADTTQAAGRVVLDCLDADCIFASSYKWLLGTHGSCVVITPDKAVHPVTARAGGWYNLANAFDEDRFERVEPFKGAAGFATGMPAFPAIYALRTGIDLLCETGVAAIAEHADRLVARVHEGLRELGFQTMSPAQPGNSSGIVSFQTENDAELNTFLLERKIHVMHQAGRIRIAIHGYNRDHDIDNLLGALRDFRG
jgi:selenocysteine lyase/cysteine desulfurase